MDVMISCGLRPTKPSYRRIPAPFPRQRRAIEQAFDRKSGAIVDPASLKSYKQALAQYHLHPESKFKNGQRLDRGSTQRRHVLVQDITQIGKEADRLDEQFHIGFE